jgi:dTDP-4-amino-4,6-dideoxygalactose transaminase
MPITERVASEILSLPMFPTLTVEQQQRVVAAIESMTRTEMPERV